MVFTIKTPQNFCDLGIFDQKTTEFLNRGVFDENTMDPILQRYKVSFLGVGGIFFSEHHVIRNDLRSVFSCLLLASLPFSFCPAVNALLRFLAHRIFSPRFRISRIGRPFSLSLYGYKY